jgi:hypothetical protein
MSIHPVDEDVSVFDALSTHTAHNYAQDLLVLFTTLELSKSSFRENRLTLSAW